MKKKYNFLPIMIRATMIAVISLLVLIFAGCGVEDPSPIQPLATPDAAVFWTPSPGERLQIQYVDEPLDIDVEAEIFSVDLFDTTIETIDALHAAGRKVICYVNTGAWEEYRPDAEDFPAAVIGRDYEGWPGEKWLDISHYDLFAPVMLARFDLALEKGCDGIDADNMQNYDEATGFSITSADQLAYNIWLSEQAHQMELSIGLKNDPEQADELLRYFDWSLIEDCQVYRWCEMLLPFIMAGKPVFQVEYTDNFNSPDSFCAQSALNGFSGFLKKRELGAWVIYCP